MTEQDSAFNREAFDARVSMYASLEFSAERTIAQLVRMGFPKDWIRAQYPDVADSAYPEPPAPKQSPDASPPRQASFLDGTGRITARNPAKATADALPKMVKALAARPTAPAALAPVAVPNNATSVAIAEPDSIAFQYVPLIQCSFPHADPGEVTSFSRRNGWLELTLSTARPDTGLPYGVPARLLTIHFASEAIRTKSPEIFLGNSVNDFLRRLEVPITRGERGSQRVYANQLLRLIHCAISIDENITDGHGRTGLHIRQALFADEARLWWDTDGAGEGSSIVLSNVLYESILERSAPLSMNAIKQLRKSPMDLDVYAWLVHRLFALGKPSHISWSQLSGQFGHGYALTRKFRSYFLDSLKRVHAVYPDAKVNVTPTGLVLLPSKRHVAPTAVTVPG